MFCNSSFSHFSVKKAYFWPKISPPAPKCQLVNIGFLKLEANTSILIYVNLWRTAGWTHLKKIFFCCSTITFSFYDFLTFSLQRAIVIQYARFINIVFFSIPSQSYSPNRVTSRTSRQHSELFRFAELVEELRMFKTYNSYGTNTLL